MCLLHHDDSASLSINGPEAFFSAEGIHAHRPPLEALPSPSNFFEPPDWSLFRLWLTSRQKAERWGSWGSLGLPSGLSGRSGLSGPIT